MAEEEVAPVSEETSEEVVESAEIQEEEIAEVEEQETEEQPSEEDSEASDQENEVGSQEADQKTEEEEPKEAKQTAQERIQQLANEKRELKERLDRLESEFQEQKTRAPKVDEDRLNNYLGELRDEIDTLRLEGKHLEADLKERQRNGLLDEYEKWQKQSKEEAARQQQQQLTKSQSEQLSRDLDDAAMFYARSKGIPEAAMDEMGKEWSEIIQADQLTARKFWEIAQKQGPVTAIEFAHDKVTAQRERVKDKAVETKEQKEQAKEKTVSVGAKHTNEPSENYKKLLAKAKRSGSDDDWAAVFAAKRS